MSLVVYYSVVPCTDRRCRVVRACNSVRFEHLLGETGADAMALEPDIGGAIFEKKPLYIDGAVPLRTNGMDRHAEANRQESVKLFC